MRVSPFLRSILTLLTGSVISQVIVFAVTPVLSRLYSPERFGVFSIYVSLVGILSGIVCWRYDMGIVLPQDEEDALAMRAIALLAAGLSSVVLWLGVFLWGDALAAILQSPDLVGWLWVLPFNLFVLGVMQTFSYWSTRHRQFAVIQKSSISRTLIGSAARLLAGFVERLNSIGLIVGNLTGDLAGAFLLARSAGGGGRFFSVEGKRLLRVARRYADLPLNSFSTVFLNSVSANAVPLLVAWLFTPYLTGLMLFAQRSLSLPLGVITSSIWQVVHAELGRLEFAERARLFSKVHKLTSYLYAFPLLAIAMFSGFSGQVFGGEWSDLQHILPALALVLYINSVSNSTSFFAAFGYYRTESVVNVVLIIFRVAALLAGYKWFDFYTAIYLYCLASFFVYLGINLFWAFQFGKVFEFIGNLAFSCAAAFALLWLPRFLYGENLWRALISVIVAGAMYYYLVFKYLQGSVRFLLGASRYE